MLLRISLEVIDENLYLMKRHLRLQGSNIKIVIFNLQISECELLRVSKLYENDS